MGARAPIRNPPQGAYPLTNEATSLNIILRLERLIAFGKHLKGGGYR